MTQTAPSSPMKRVEDWKSRLIDLSRKNNLLYFHKSKRGNLSITQHDPQKILDSLVLKKNRLEFFIQQEAAQKLEATEKQKAKGKNKAKAGKTEAKTAKAPVKAATTPEEPKRPTANQLVSGSLSRIDLERNLKSLQSRSLLYYMERCVRILHACFGTLNWVDAETKEKVKSPLILVPL